MAVAQRNRSIDEWRRLRPLAHPRGLWRFVRAIGDAFLEHDLLTAASAIAFQVLFALIPLALALLALAGYLGLEEVWTRDIAPKLREQTSQAGFDVIDGTARRVLGSHQGTWLTLGMALMLWEVAAAVRAVMGTLNRIFGLEEERRFLRRLLVSLALALVVPVCVALSMGALHFTPIAVRELGGGLGLQAAAFVVRWLVAIVPLFVLMGLVVRYAPARREHSRWLGVGAIFAVVAWIGTSFVFTWYLTSVAHYRSLYGGVATAIALMTYLYASSVAFLVGVQIDALVRKQLLGGERVVTRGEATRELHPGSWL